MSNRSSIVGVISSGVAGPWVYVLLGLVLAASAGLLASNFHGLGEKYILLTARRDKMTDRQRARIVKRYRIVYGVACVLGVLMVVSGIAGVK
jgi:hypothetical protein